MNYEKAINLGKCTTEEVKTINRGMEIMKEKTGTCYGVKDYVLKLSRKVEQGKVFQ